MPDFHFFPFCFFITCPVMNSSTLFGLKQVVVTGIHACFLSIYRTRRLHRNIVIRASSLNSAVLSPLQFLAIHILTYKSILFYWRRGKKGKKSSQRIRGKKKQKISDRCFLISICNSFPITIICHGLVKNSWQIDKTRLKTLETRK